MNQHLTAAEQDGIAISQTNRERCVCGEVHENDGDGVTPAVIVRMQAYLAENPGHQFAVDDEAGIAAVIIACGSGQPEVVAWSGDLIELLDHIGAPPAEDLTRKPAQPGRRQQPTAEPSAQDLFGQQPACDCGRLGVFGGSSG